MKKKIALVLTGHLRSHKENLDNLKKFLLDNNNVDIFVSTWDINYTGPKRPNKNKPNVLAFRKFNDDEIKENLKIYPNVKALKIHSADKAHEDTYEKFSSLIGKKWQNGKAVKSCVAWYCVSEGFKLVENPNDYDILMRFRFDINLVSPLELKSNTLVVTPSEHKAIFKVRNHFQYGTPAIHNFMTSMYDNMMATYSTSRDLLSEQILEKVLANSNLDLLIDKSYVQDKNYILNKY